MSQLDPKSLLQPLAHHLGYARRAASSGWRPYVLSMRRSRRWERLANASTWRSAAIVATVYMVRSHLLNAVRLERRKPPLPPGFPGTEPPTMPPPFPGRLIPASHHRLLVAHEQLQQPELTRCQRDLRPAALHPVPTWIQGARASGSGS
jgi:hypothetical protein